MGKGQSVTGFVLSLVGLVLSILGTYFSIIALPVSIVGLVLSVLGGKKVKASGEKKWVSNCWLSSRNYCCCFFINILLHLRNLRFSSRFSIKWVKWIDVRFYKQYNKV